MFCKKRVPRNFAKFTGKHLCQSLFLNGLQLYLKNSLAQLFSCEISKNTFFLYSTSGGCFCLVCKSLKLVHLHKDYWPENSKQNFLPLEKWIHCLNSSFYFYLLSPIWTKDEHLMRPNTGKHVPKKNRILTFCKHCFILVFKNSLIMGTWKFFIKLSQSEVIPYSWSKALLNQDGVKWYHIIILISMRKRAHEKFSFSLFPGIAMKADKMNKL